MQSENSRTVRAVLDFQHPFLPFQVFLVQQGRGDGTGFDEVARLAGVVVVGALLVGQLVLGDELAFQFQEVVHGGAVRVFDEEDAAGYGVAVVVQTEVEPFEQVGKVVHGQLQVDGEQGQLGRLAFVEEDIGILVVVEDSSACNSYCFLLFSIFCSKGSGKEMQLGCKVKIPGLSGLS